MDRYILVGHSRPSEKAVRRMVYSGKKKRLTYNTNVYANADGAANFHEAWGDHYRARSFLWKDTVHIRHIHMKGDRNNNRMERLNGTIRDREVACRGIKKVSSPLFDGFQTYYNFMKRHGGIGRMTPAEAAGILVDGPNKWKTIIQNAALSRY